MRGGATKKLFKRSDKMNEEVEEMEETEEIENGEVDEIEEKENGLISTLQKLISKAMVTEKKTDENKQTDEEKIEELANKRAEEIIAKKVAKAKANAGAEKIQELEKEQENIKKRNEELDKKELRNILKENGVIPQAIDDSVKMFQNGEFKNVDEFLEKKQYLIEPKKRMQATRQAIQPEMTEKEKYLKNRGIL